MNVSLACDLFTFTNAANLQHIHTIIHQVRSHLVETFDLLRVTAFQKADQTWRTTLLEVLRRFFVLVGFLALGTVEIGL
jgi:hypothetical protein